MYYTTKYGMRRMLLENLKRKNNFFYYKNPSVMLTNKEFSNLVQLVYKTLPLTFPLLPNFLNYLKSWAECLSLIGLGVEGVTPNGLIVKLKNRKITTKIVPIYVNGFKSTSKLEIVDKFSIFSNKQMSNPTGTIHWMLPI